MTRAASPRDALQRDSFCPTMTVLLVFCRAPSTVEAEAVSQTQNHFKNSG